VDDHINALVKAVKGIAATALEVDVVNATARPG
jgi:hypothetical protein